MPLTIFDHIGKLYSKYDPTFWDSLDNESKKSFNVYMLNRWLSMYPANVEIVNELQKYMLNMSKEDIYRFYTSILDNKNKPFLKYIKIRKKQYPTELLNIICKYYQESIKQAKSRVELLLLKPDGVDRIKKFLSYRGYDSKEISKLIKGIK